MPPLEQITAAILGWARSRPDLRALALAGSYARGTARPHSDIDFLLLTPNPEIFRTDWLEQIAWPPGLARTTIRDATYGIAWSRHIGFADHAEVELTFAPLAWAARPIDPGTRRVITTGFLPLHDPEGHLATLLSAI